MAQRAIIGINGDLIPFSEDLDRIRTPGLGGSAVTWVPDADTICDQLKVTANGTYSAAEAGKYGYDYVVVSVPGSSVTGRDPDTGEEVEVHPDPETGEIVTTVLPTKIRVITPPAKTDYADGETIDYSGIVVHAYSSTGQDMGAVPFGELVFPVSKTELDSDANWTDGAGVTAGRYSTGTVIERVGAWGDFYVGDYIGECIGGQYVGMTIKLGEAPESGGGHFIFATYYGGKYYLRLDSQNNSNSVSANTIYVSDKPIINGSFGRVFKTQWEEGSNDYNRYIFPKSTVDPTTVDPANIHATQSLPVQWPRTPDGAVLETTTTINVTGGST